MPPDSRRSLRRIPANLRLVAGATPFVALAVVAKIAAAELDIQPIHLNPLLSGLVAANVFLLGFLLAGTLADFKESERLPADLASSLETIADECLIIESKAREPARAAISQLAEIACGVRQWLHGDVTHTEVLSRVRELNEAFVGLEPHTQAAFLNRLKIEQGAVRRHIIRIETIRRTSFVAAGYLIAEITAALVVTAMVLSDIGLTGEGAFFVGAITMLLVYVIRLIRDLDNPFEYRYGAAGGADVSIAPVEEVARRLRSFVSADPLVSSGA